ALGLHPLAAGVATHHHAELELVLGLGHGGKAEDRGGRERHHGHRARRVTHVGFSSLECAYWVVVAAGPVARVLCCQAGIACCAALASGLSPGMAPVMSPTISETSVSLTVRVAMERPSRMTVMRSATLI